MKPKRDVSFVVIGLGLLGIVAVYFLQARAFSFTQDDAFISYRYVQNYLSGQGLVFNFAERVEGYTNFFWVILLILFGRWGVDIIGVSKVLGVCSGVVLLFLLYDFSRRLWSDQPVYTHLSAPLWLAVSAVFAYWGISGLEESFYTLCWAGGVFCFVSRQPLYLPFFILSAVIRPEGLLVFVLAEVGGFLFLKRSLQHFFRDTALFILGVAPLYGFRLWYYGFPFPNTFYAKVDLSWAYLKSGGAYLWLFFKQYGFYGILPALIAATYKRMTREERFLLFLVAFYSAYVLVVGGDWLQGHRFLLPIFPLLLLLFQRTIWRLLHLRFPRRSAHRVLFGAAVVGCTVLLVMLPWQTMRMVHRYSKGLVEGMTALAKAFVQVTPERTSIALSDIGAFSYYLGNRTIMDLWGLTDTYIPRHPNPVPGIQSGWKERTYNVDYVLSRRPDYILFSTNVKPVTPAEQAFFLHSSFRKAYSLWEILVDRKLLYSVYRRTRPVPTQGQLWTNPEFLIPLRQGLSLSPGQRGAFLRKALDSGPKDFALLWNEVAFDDWRAGRIDEALTHNAIALGLDSLLGAGYLLRAKIYERQGWYAERDSVLLQFWRVCPEGMCLAGVPPPRK